MTLRDAIARLVDGHELAGDEMVSAVGVILAGDATPAQIAAFLVALRMKGETTGELTAAARALRAAAVPVVGAPADAIDTCGTGGDGASTVNVSTLAGLVAAGAGVPVAKHGNRAVSGAVGAADVLEALGVTVALPPEALAACLHAVGFAFLFAPALHPALRHAAGPRRELGVRTLFNLLGPLCNPAGVRRQVVGVFARRWLEPVATALRDLGTERAWVVHANVGLDEIALDGDTAVVEVAGGRLRAFTVCAADAGLATSPIDRLRVGSLGDAAARIRTVLAGEPGPARDVTCLNAAAALVVAGRAPTLRDGVALATAALDSGRAQGVLERLTAFTTRAASS